MLLGEWVIKGLDLGQGGDFHGYLDACGFFVCKVRTWKEKLFVNISDLEVKQHDLSPGFAKSIALSS